MFQKFKLINDLYDITIKCRTYDIVIYDDTGFSEKYTIIYKSSKWSFAIELCKAIIETYLKHNMDVLENLLKFLFMMHPSWDINIMKKVYLENVPWYKDYDDRIEKCINLR